jgi:ketosteroid isomerase-like protein
MKPSNIHPILAVLWLCFAIHQECRPQQNPASTPALDAVCASLLKTDSEFNDFAAKKGTVEAFLAYMADNAVMFPNGGDTISGRENIRKDLSEGPADAVLSWKPLHADAASSSDLGYTFGTYEYKFTGKDGKPATHYGKYLTVWKKQADGTWKFVADIGNPSPSPGHK